MRYLTEISTKKELRLKVWPVYQTLKAEAVWVDCPKCAGGNGYISAFSHVRGGVCFKCGGSGVRAGNLAAKRASKLNALYGGIAHALKLNRTGLLRAAPSSYLNSMDEFLSKLPKKLQVLLAEGQPQ